MNITAYVGVAMLILLPSCEGAGNFVRAAENRPTVIHVPPPPHVSDVSPVAKIRVGNNEYTVTNKVTNKRGLPADQLRVTVNGIPRNCDDIADCRRVAAQYGGRQREDGGGGTGH